MTQEDKELLLKDICARLPYGVKINHINAYNEVNGAPCVLDIQDYKNNDPLILINSNWLPYLRPMSSMTEEEYETIRDCFVYCGDEFIASGKAVDFLNSNHFDYRDLISKGLAFEAPEGMYNEE